MPMSSIDPDNSGSLASVGKRRRLARWFHGVPRRTILLPLDDSLIAGPEAGLEDLGALLLSIQNAPPDAVMGFPGLFMRHARFLENASMIVNLTGSTTRSAHTRKVLVSGVDQAMRLGADAVAVHVNISSSFEPEMLRALGLVARECDSAGMPLLAIMYPRREARRRDDNYEHLRRTQPGAYASLVAHATRVGVDLGADIIKTHYTGDSGSFRKVIRAAEGRPVLIAGGPRLPAAAALRMASGALDAGAAGVSFGRNVFGRSDPAKFLAVLRALLHGKAGLPAAQRRFSQGG